MTSIVGAVNIGCSDAPTAGRGSSTPPGTATEAAQRRNRWIRHLADEVAYLAGRGARGTRQGLLDHLRGRFGSVDVDDLLAALDHLPAETVERFA